MKVRPEETLLGILFIFFAVLRYTVGLTPIPIICILVNGALIILLSFPILFSIHLVRILYVFLYSEREDYVKNHLKWHTNILKEEIHFFMDSLPFVLMFIAYDVLVFEGNVIHLINPNDKDLMLIYYDQKFFGFQASHLTQLFIRPWVTGLMQIAYSLHFILPIAVAAVIYFSRQKTMFRDIILGIVLVNFIGFLGYFIVPAVGPSYHLHYSVPLQLSNLPTKAYNMVYNLEELSESTPRNVFPGLHVGLSTVVLVFAYKFGRKTFIVLTPFVLLEWFSTIYLRIHYLVDNVAGFILALFCIWCSQKINRWWYRRTDYS